MLSRLLLTFLAFALVANEQQAFAAAKRVKRVTMCHKIDDNYWKWSKVLRFRIKAHRRHGDARPGEKVPGRGHLKFDKNCKLIDTRNDCVPNPCRNGGRCIDLFEEFRCLCEPGFNGDTCSSTPPPPTPPPTPTPTVTPSASPSISPTPYCPLDVQRSCKGPHVCSHANAGLCVDSFSCNIEGNSIGLCHHIVGFVAKNACNGGSTVCVGRGPGVSFHQPVEAKIGENSCNGSFGTCTASKSLTIGDRSCAGSTACSHYGEIQVGDNSCTDNRSCGFSSLDGGHAGTPRAKLTVGHRSCLGEDACRTRERRNTDVQLQIGNDSCQADEACVNTRNPSWSVGDNACNCKGCCRNCLKDIPSGKCNFKPGTSGNVLRSCLQEFGCV